MRIGIDCRLWNQTGVGRYIRNLVAQLQKIDKENEYVLFVRDEDDVLVKNKNWKTVSANLRWHSIAEQVKFAKVLKREKLDLVHFPYFSHPIFYNKPFVVTIHDLIINHYPTGKASTLPLPLYFTKRIMYNRVLSHAVKKSKKIIVPLDAVAKDVEQTLHVSPNKIAVTYEGAPEVQNKQKNGKYEVPYAKYFLYIGNAYPHKNLERLMKAFQIFSSRISDVKLILVGKEDYFYKRLKQEVKNLDLEERILFTGFVSDEKLSALYGRAVALIIPSLMEGFGLPALEAMENNCLVVCSDISSLKEVCGDNAFYFNPKDTEAMANMMEVVYNLTDNERNTYRQKAGKYIKNFSWEKMAQETLAVYKSCARL